MTLLLPALKGQRLQSLLTLKMCLSTLPEKISEKIKRILFILPVLFSISYAQTKKPAVKTVAKKTPEKVVLNTTDSLSYAMGVQTAEYYKAQGAQNINPAMVKKAYDDVYTNKTLLISPEQCNMNIQTK